MVNVVLLFAVFQRKSLGLRVSGSRAELLEEQLTSASPPAVQARKKPAMRLFQAVISKGLLGG